MEATSQQPLSVRCGICGERGEPPNSKDVGVVRGNTQRFLNQKFRVWKCPRCLTIWAVDPADLADIYSDYALKKRKLDVFARGTSANLLGRLTSAGLKKTDRILDYGCGEGIFVRYLKDRGYTDVTGYDPYAEGFIHLPTELAPFDCVVNNDTIEHCDDPRRMMSECAALLRAGGLLYVGTADSEPVDMQHLEREVMRLHQPFHRMIVTEKTLHALGKEQGLELVASYRRSYHDTLRPFVNYRFLDELNNALGDNLDRALDPRDAGRVIMRSPRLWWYGLVGYFFPTADEPAMVLRKPA